MIKLENSNLTRTCLKFAKSSNFAVCGVLFWLGFIQGILFRRWFQWGMWICLVLYCFFWFTYHHILHVTLQNTHWIGSEAPDIYIRCELVSW